MALSVVAIVFIAIGGVLVLGAISYIIHGCLAAHRRLRQQQEHTPRSLESASSITTKTSTPSTKTAVESVQPRGITSEKPAAKVNKPPPKKTQNTRSGNTSTTHDSSYIYYSGGGWGGDSGGSGGGCSSGGDGGGGGGGGCGGGDGGGGGGGCGGGDGGGC
ncbi:hypothetical protein BGW38_000064 [Lunasporangiospora selenospora]|uniref:Uncharacterized protein n=1 Tax=Lunasporangiospora selenospora TaxID=979761 RepID=A0A9P6FVE2_9FUNG|nr:hypothetical protein BGW38_000064 [Lunasporangiospora selenospora]